MALVHHDEADLMVVWFEENPVQVKEKGK